MVEERTEETEVLLDRIYRINRNFFCLSRRKAEGFCPKLDGI
jgi:hypothetical protein